MPDPTKHGIECTEFDALLSDAMDGAALTGARKESFDAHRRICPTCGPLFADVQAGKQWLRSLEEVEPPVHLVHNILVATTGVVSTRALRATAGGRSTPFGERVREWWGSFVTPVSGFVRQPRFVMSFGMIFFSFSLALNVAGVKASDVAKVDLRPSSLRHAYTDAQIKVVKYYDNIRFVYEIESKVRELKRANTPAEPGPATNTDDQKDNRKNNTSGQPEQRQDRNYSQQGSANVLAGITESSDASSTSLLATSYELRASSNLGSAPSAKLIAHGHDRGQSSLPRVIAATNRRFV